MNTFANRSLPVQLSLAKLFTFRWQFTYGDYLDWKTETKELPLLEGITIVYTNVNIFARIKLRKKFFPKEISEALEALLELDEVAFSF